MKIKIFAGIMLALIGLFAVNVFSVPGGPETITVEDSTFRNNLGDIGTKSVQGIAGNVSELAVNGTSITQGWQGYYGNISGAIVLDDANNYSMYTWEFSTVGVGEVYATRDSDGINWSDTNIICANITHIEAEETTLNFNGGTGQDVDGINETFSQLTHQAFNVSTTSFAADSCNFTVSTYVDDAAGDRTFNETLLYSDTDSALIYAAMIFPGGSDGFRNNNINYDFQMLVAEDGHNLDVTPTSYYFYIELD